MIRAAQLLTCSMLLAACSDSTSSQNADLATLKRVTSPFRTFSAATTAGWSTKITSCMADQTLGGMGFHYGNTALIDGTLKRRWIRSARRWPSSSASDRGRVYDSLISIPRRRSSAMYVAAGMHSSGVWTPGGATCPRACISPVIDSE